MTLAEQIVLSPAQEMANVIKLRGIETSQQQTALVGHIITFKKSNDVLIQELNEIKNEIRRFPKPESIGTTLSVAFVHAKISCASLIPVAYKTSSIQVDPEKVYKWCEIKKKIDPLWKDILIDSSPEMTRRLKLIPKTLVDAATYIENDKATAVEKLIEKLSKNNVETTDFSDKKVDGSTEEQSVFITNSSSIQEGNHSAEKLLLKSKCHF